MRKCVGVLMVCAILLSIGSTAQATRTWISGNIGNWSDTANWSGGSLPSALETAQINTTGTTGAVVDDTRTAGILLMSNVTGSVGVLNINSGANLTLNKASTELFCLGKVAGSTETVNQSGGTVTVGAGAGTGETRLVTASATLGTAIYNLSGGTLDTEVLSKGNKTNSSAQFNATGGTLVLRNMIYRFGKISEGAGFNQGTATLEVGAIGTVATVNVGNSTNMMDYTVNTGGTLNIDIASASSYDRLSQFVDAVTTTNINYANTAGATLSIDLLSGYTPTVGSFFDVWTFSGTNGMGSGTFGVIPAGWTAAWIDSGTDGVTDTLRLTFTPEPATITLLGLGLLAMRRNKK